MSERRPLVLDDGFISELPQGDSLSSPYSISTQIVAGSGLSGGGAVSSGVTLDISLAPNPSGLIFVGDSLGINGATQALANAAVSSGTAAISVATNALASGNNSIVVSDAALASGNAALTVVPTINNTNLNQVTYTAASAIVSGYAVGVDGAGRVQSINRLVADSFSPPVINTPITAVDRRFPELSQQSLASSLLDNSFILYYIDLYLNLNYPVVKGGMISGNSAVFGTPAVLESISSYSAAAVCLSTENKYLLTHNNSSLVKSCVLSASGTSVFAGSITTVNSLNGLTTSTRLAARSSSQQVVAIAYKFGVPVTSGCVGTISGLSVSYGSPVNLGQANFEAGLPGLVYDSVSDRFIQGTISGTFTSNNAYDFAVLTISGSSLIRSSYTSAKITAANFGYAGYNLTLTSLPNTYLLVGASGNRNIAVATTLSGSTFSAGPETLVGSGTSNFINSSFDPISERILVFEGGAANVNATIKSITLSGLTPVLNLPATGVGFSSFNYTPPIIYNPATNRQILAYGTNAVSGRLNVLEPFRAYGYVPRNSVGPNILGVAQSTVASGSPCIVNLPGSIYTTPSGNFSTGAFYYADPTTSGLTTSAVPAPLWSGQTPWNYVGRAVSASGIMVLKTL